MKNLLLGLTISFSLGQDEQLLACDCPFKPPLDSAFRSVDAVVLGTILSAKPIRILTGDSCCTLLGANDSGGENAMFVRAFTKYSVRVVRTYKGKNRADTIAVITPTGSSLCGYPFEVGKKYFIYGWEGGYLDGVIDTTSCERTLAYNRRERKMLKRIASRKL